MTLTKGNVTKFINRLSYQHLNTIPFTKDEVKELIKKDIEYINKLKNDTKFFLKEIYKGEELEIPEIDELFEDDEEIETNKNIDVVRAFVKLYSHNPEVEKTQVFKDFKRNYIDACISELRKGRVKVDNMEYATAVGNPYEMLLSVVGKFTGKSETLKDNELFCSRFKDGENVIGFRNPHINVGNCGIQVNRHNALIDKYFNHTPLIVFLNSIDFPTLSTYQGEDFDSDTNLLTNDPIIVNACKRIDKNITPIPVNAIASTSSNHAKMTDRKNLAIVDHFISQNYIGSVINLSQQINSYYNDLVYNKNADEDTLQDLYNKTSRLSSLSCVEIDKAKKNFKELDVLKEIEEIKSCLPVIEKKHTTVVRKPEFFKYIGDTNAQDNRRKAEKNHLKRKIKNSIKEFCGKDENLLESLQKLSVKELIEKLENNEELKGLKVKIDKNIEENNEYKDRYVSINTPMDWVQLEVDKIKNKRKIGTIQVIQLIKKNTNKVDEALVSEVVGKIRALDKDIKATRQNKELKYRQRKDNIDSFKEKTVKYLQDVKLTKANMYAVLRECLNTVKKHKNRIVVNKKSGIESLSLELLFKAYGEGLLCMFQKQEKKQEK